MEKVSSMEIIDMDEWEFLPSHEHGFINLGNDHIGKSSTGTPTTCLLSTQPCYGLVEMNYFICPSPQSESLDLNRQKKISDVDLEETKQQFKDIDVVPQEEKDRDPISQVFFKKLNDSGFADMKVESPKSGINAKPVPDFDSALIPFVGENEKSNNIRTEKDHDDDEDVEVLELKPKPCLDGFGIKIWRWRIAGIGAICSIGVAAATLCIFILGGAKHQKNQHHAHKKIQFNIYADDKGIKQAMQQATRLNQTLSAARGTPTMASISFGACYDYL